MAETFTLTGDGDNALLALKQMTELEPDSEDTWIELGMFLADRGKVNETIEAFDKAISINPHLIHCCPGQLKLGVWRGIRGT